MVGTINKKHLLEIFIIYLLIPCLIIFFNLTKYFLLILILICLITLICYPVKKKEFSKRFNKKFCLFVSFVLFFVITLFSFLDKNTFFFGFIKELPNIWFIVFIIYPTFSVIPQEIIYRHFFFQRYGYLFKNENILIIFNSLLFAYGHIIFLNLEAVFISFLGSIIFTYSYLKESLLMCIFLHILAGQLIFFSGLGYYFLKGTISYIN